MEDGKLYLLKVEYRSDAALDRLNALFERGAFYSRYEQQSDSPPVQVHRFLYEPDAASDAFAIAETLGGRLVREGIPHSVTVYDLNPAILSSFGFKGPP